MNSQNTYELKPPASEAGQSTSHSAQNSSAVSCWQRIRAAVVIIITVGWCIYLVITIKSAFDDNIVHESELKNIQHIASILFKLADLKFLPISEPGSDPNNLEYLLRTLNERNTSKTVSPLL